MAFYFPEGTRLYFSTTLDTAKSITALTNANPAVATSAAHGFVDGDELLVNSGWGDIDEMVFKADQITADTFGLVDLDTTDAGFYPPGSGTGTAKKISTWVEVPQLLTLSTDGGDTRFTDVGLLSRRQDIRIPTGFNPSSMNMTLAWDPNQANFKAMLAISRTIRQAAMKIAGRRCRHCWASSAARGPGLQPQPGAGSQRRPDHGQPAHVLRRLNGFGCGRWLGGPGCCRRWPVTAAAPIPATPQAASATHFYPTGPTMSICIEIDDVVKFNVKGSFADRNGKDQPFSFSLTCNRVPPEVLDETMQQGSKFIDFFSQYTLDWSGVLDADHKPVYMRA